MSDLISSSQFDAWVIARRKKLLRIAMSVLKNSDEAEDVVQDTLLSIWQMSAKSAIKNLEAYAARSVWVNAVKYRSRRRETVSFEEHGSGYVRSDDKNIPEEDDLAPMEVERAISTLPLAQQIVIRLRYYGDMSFREIGSSLSISINTAASRYRYAVKALKRALLGVYKELYHGKK